MWAFKENVPVDIWFADITWLLADMKEGKPYIETGQEPWMGRSRLAASLSNQPDFQGQLTTSGSLSVLTIETW